MSYQHLDSATAQVILNALPDPIRRAYLAHAVEIEYPIEAVLEMALAGFLDSEALSFLDCKPDLSDIAQAS